MLRASVSLSRKITRDFNSTGYSLTFDGEIPFQLGDNEAILEKVSELFHLAEEALQVEIDRDQCDQAIGSRDEEPVDQRNRTGFVQANGQTYALPVTTPNNGAKGRGEDATPKQIQFLQTMARRNRLTDRQLENRVTEVIGRTCSLSGLTKKEAGILIDNLSGAPGKKGG